MSTILQGRPIANLVQFRLIAVRICSERTLDDDVTVLAEGRALHGEGERGARRGLRVSVSTIYSALSKIDRINRAPARRSGCASRRQTS